MDNMELAKVFEEVCIKYRKQIADLETQLKECRMAKSTNPFEDAVVAENSQRIVALEQELGAVKMQLQNVIAERDTVEAKRKSVWKKYDNLTAQMEGLRENHRKEKASLEAKIEKLTINTVDRENTILKQLIASKDQEITFLNKQLNEANMVICNLKTEIPLLKPDPLINIENFTYDEIKTINEDDTQYDIKYSKGVEQLTIMTHGKKLAWMLDDSLINEYFMRKFNHKPRYIIKIDSMQIKKNNLIIKSIKVYITFNENNYRVNLYVNPFTSEKGYQDYKQPHQIEKYEDQILDIVQFGRELLIFNSIIIDNRVVE